MEEKCWGVVSSGFEEMEWMSGQWVYVSVGYEWIMVDYMGWLNENMQKF